MYKLYDEFYTYDEMVRKITLMPSDDQYNATQILTYRNIVAILEKGKAPRLAHKIRKLADNLEKATTKKHFTTKKQKEKITKKHYKKCVKLFEKYKAFDLRNISGGFNSVLLASLEENDYYKLPMINGSKSAGSTVDEFTQEQCETITKNFRRKLKGKKMKQKQPQQQTK